MDFHRSVPSFLGGPPLVGAGPPHMLVSLAMAEGASMPFGALMLPLLLLAPPGAPGVWSTSHEVSCFTLAPPQPSWEKSASRTEFSCSSCLEVEADAADAPAPAAPACWPLAIAPGSLLGGRPLLAAEAQEVLPPAAPAEAPAAEETADTEDD